MTKATELFEAIDAYIDEKIAVDGMLVSETIEIALREAIYDIL